MIKNLSTIILLLFFVGIANSQQNTTIPNADPFCSDTGILFQNVSDGSQAEGGINYDCLTTQPNPSWFYIRIDLPGNLSFQIEQNTQDDFTGNGLDVDFIAWGPFRENELEDIQNGNYGILNGRIVDCSYEPFNIETLNIPNAETGSYYLILITNYIGDDGFIRMYENFPGQAGTGTTDCSIVAGALDDQDVCLGEEVRLDGAPISGEPSDYTYKWFLDIGDGNGFTEMVGETNQILVIDNDVSGIYKIEVTDDTGATDEEEAEINFYSQPTITPLVNPLYEVFDLDGTEDNYTTINLRDLFDEDFLNGQDPTVYIVNYYQSQEDAEANENEIPNPRTYTNFHDNADLTDDIFARVVTIAAPNTCDPVVEPFKVLVKINQPPVLSADFRGAYCPLSDIKIAENFTITDSDDTGLDFFTIQISEGYSNPNDLLELTGTHPTVTARPFDIIEGKLILEPTAPATEIAYADLEAAVRDIIFTSTDPDISGERSFSFTIGDANYLPLTEHFYVYEENIGITWSDAKNLADASTYFGLQGYLATILSEEESVISAEQISGTGWIGASDEEREGEWKWVTGPEAGTLFWNGDFNGGPAPDPDGNPYYSNWNNDEPNNSNNEDYAHITDNSIGIPGSWNDLANTGSLNPNSPYHPKGYIVEYGGTPGDPVLNISTSTSIFIPEITAGLDQRNCTGGSVTLTASVTEGDLFWYDQPNGGTLIFTGDTFTTPVLNSSKTYYLDALPIGCDTNQRIAIEAIIDTTPIVINTPPDINRCDEDRVGFLDFDLQDTPTVDQVLNSLDPILNPDLSDFEVLYFDNISDAELNTTSAIIANPYRVNTSTNPTIYVRIHNIDNPNCFAITEFKLKVTDVPEPTQPINWRKCDDDTDGISSFLLNTKDAEILATVANPSDYTISYHTLLIDAQTSSTTNAIDKDVDYLVTNSQRVYVRVENIANTDCNAISDDSAGSTFTSFELIVDAAPVVVTPPLDINRCDEDRVGFLDFDLITDQTPQILNGLDPSLDTSVFEVLYFDNLSDAESNTTTAIIANPYRVNTSSNPTIYARVHNINNTSCYSIVDFKLKVTDTPTPTQPTVYRICDDTASGSDTDGISSFLLNTKDAEILTGVTNPGEYTISYHTLLVDAQTSSTANAIDKDTDYQVTTSQRVYVRIENNNDPSQCYIVSDESASSTFTSFELIVDPLPVISGLIELKQCDDDNDGFSLFNLNEVIPEISSNYLNETIVLYPSLLNAENDTEAFSVAETLVFENRTATTDQVWAKITSDQGCYRYAEINLIVSTTGIAGLSPRTFIECDDFLDIDGNDTANNDDNDGITSFDFSSVTDEVRAEFPISQQLTITYYRNLADGLAELNAIADPSNYRNIGYPVTQQIYIRVDSDLDNDCLGFGPFITLTVEPVTAQEVGPLEFCDNDIDGNFSNGIVQTFDLESQTAAILGTQDPLNFTVSYHLSDVDALSGADPILNTSLYENIIPNLQTIYVRVANNTSGCFTAQTSFDLIVNPLPIANFVNDLEVCDDNTDGSAQNGFSQTFDLELQTAGILGTQDPTQFSVTYHASLANAQAGALPLGSPFSNSVPFSQIIYARVYNAATGCVNDISNFNAIVNPEPTTENASNLSYCDDDSDGDDTNGFVQNIDLDSQITDILGTLQDPDDFNVTFHETQTDASDGTDALSSPYTNTLADQQTIYVRVENKDTGCVNDDFTFEVIVNPLPKFKVTSPQIVCLSGPPLTLFIENPVAVYDYVWTAPNGDESFGEEITIESGGVYTVTATTTNGTDCTRTREILVNESIIATITDQDVTIVDDSDNNSITIDPTNLGIGDYQYALIDENNLQTAFQDIPVFENLTGGFYTIVVQDKNGCRPDATLVVSVIEYPKFFTPNNDGINDTWAIKGANSTFYPSAQINIFNRFGKVVAQIDVDNPGWDGTYGGKILSSDDYWFSIILVDRNGNARERKGNFSLLRR